MKSTIRGIKQMKYLITEYNKEHNETYVFFVVGLQKFIKIVQEYNLDNYKILEPKDLDNECCLSWHIENTDHKGVVYIHCVN